MLGAAEGDTLLIVADRAARRRDRARPAAPGRRSRGRGQRHLLGRRLPAFEWNEDEKRLEPMHHPFTAPAGDLDADPATWRSRGYDVVLNGTEIGGGSIRINTPDVQRRVFEAIGIDADEAEERFGFLLEALKYGAPPHGGIAFGLDRIVAILAGRDSIRDVMAFPKTATGGDPMTGAPAPVDAVAAARARAPADPAEAVERRAGPGRALRYERPLHQQHVAPLAVELTVAQVQCRRRGSRSGAAARCSARSPGRPWRSASRSRARAPRRPARRPARGRCRRRARRAVT